jgi:tetratricopeptide (TPR) repeat protein/TolB-like protein
LTKALQKNPADRFVTAQQFIEALETPTAAIPLAESATKRKRPVWQWAAGFIAVVAVVVGGFVLFDGWRSGAATAAADEIDRLVVVPFENRTGDTAAADWGFFAAEYITRAIDRVGIVTVVPASGVRDLVRDVDPDVSMPLREISRRTGARYAVAGSYSTLGGSVRFDVELVDGETGELLRSLDPIAGPADSLEAVTLLLAERVTAAAAALLTSDVDLAFARMSSPPSLDLVRGLVATQEHFCSARFVDAIDEAQAVLQETPDFAPLLLMVAISYGNRRRFNREADSILTLIEPLREQLTSQERGLEDMTRGRLNGDHAQRTRATEQLYRIQPSGFGYHAGLVALQTNRFEDALERFLATDLDTPCYRRWWPWWLFTAHTYHLLGRYEEELDVARRGLERFPGRRALMFNEVIAQAGLGRMDAVDSLLGLIADLPPEERARDVYNPGSQTAMVALELKVLGHEEVSKATMKRALDWFAARPASELRFERAQALYWAERWSDAERMFAALLEGAPDNLEYQGYHGVALAHLGRREEALDTDSWLEQLDRPYLQGEHLRWRAAIAAALGEREAAIQLLHQAYDQGMQLGYFFRRDPEWRPLYGYGPYEEFVKPR